MLLIFLDVLWFLKLVYFYDVLFEVVQVDFVVKLEVWDLVVGVGIYQFGVELFGFFIIYDGLVEVCDENVEVIS